jgi:thioredoxin 1
MSELVLSVTDDTFEEDVLNCKSVVLVDFWAPWCGPCKMITPLLETLAKQRGDTLKVVKINVDENAEVLGRYNVMGIPTLLLFSAGEVIGKHVGALTISQLNTFVDDNDSAIS